MSQPSTVSHLGDDDPGVERSPEAIAPPNMISEPLPSTVSNIVTAEDLIPGLLGSITAGDLISGLLIKNFYIY